MKQLEKGLRLLGAVVVAGLAAGLGACSGNGGGNAGTTSGGTSGGTMTSCQQQFNPELIGTDDCTPLYDQYCPNTTTGAPLTNDTSVSACDGVTVTSGTASTANLSTDYVELNPSDASTVHTLYVALHGTGETGTTIANRFRFAELAKARNLTVVAPSAPGPFKSWGDSLLDTSSTPTERIALIDALIAQLQGTGHAYSKVIIVGASGGGVLALEYTCAHPSTIAGMMLVGAPITPSQIAACSSGLNVATLQVHGTSDFVAPYNAGSLGIYAGAPAVFSDLSADNACTQETLKTATMSDPSQLISGIDLQWLKPCGGRGSALVTVKGGGHEWPGYNGPITLPVNAFGPVATGFNTTLQGYDFLTYLGAGS